jgi:hypothetical protein
LTSSSYLDQIATSSELALGKKRENRLSETLAASLSVLTFLLFRVRGFLWFFQSEINCDC